MSKRSFTTSYLLYSYNGVPSTLLPALPIGVYDFRENKTKQISNNIFLSEIENEEKKNQILLPGSNK